jgi:hypothetical protein
MIRLLRYDIQIADKITLILLHEHPLLGNGLINMFPQKQTHRTIGRIAKQRSCKHASLTKEDGVFRGVRADELS